MTSHECLTMSLEDDLLCPQGWGRMPAKEVGEVVVLARPRWEMGVCRSAVPALALPGPSWAPDMQMAARQAGGRPPRAHVSASAAAASLCALRH